MPTARVTRYPTLLGFPHGSAPGQPGLVPTDRTDLLRRRLIALAARTPDLKAYIQAVCEIMSAAVGADFACLATADPATLLITGSVKSHPGDSRDEAFAYEYATDDVNLFGELSRRAVPVGILDRDTGGYFERSTRYRELLLPHFGLGHELRAVFRSAGSTWGGIGIYRSAGPHPFSTVDAKLVAAVAGLIADGIRTTLITTPITAGPLADAGPAVIVLNPDGRPELLTPAAEQRLDDLGGITHGALPISLLSLAAATTCAADRPMPAATRMRTPHGWISARAAPVAATGQTVITLDQANPAEVLPLLAAGYGLTNREQQIVQQVLLGADTAAIARQLFLSPYTVQDHLKAIFAKVGVTSRRQLAAAIFFQQNAPHIGNPLAPDGSIVR